ncbi:MAG: BufA2 family periplasmic bufferin-type metallophore [Rhodospirillales bacterium]
MKKTGIVLAATAAAAFATAGIVGSFSPAQAAVKCVGANACKGQSACKTATSSCKGLNACKGQGWVESADKAACEKSGGKVS